MSINIPEDLRKLVEEVTMNKLSSIRVRPRPWASLTQ